MIRRYGEPVKSGQTYKHRPGSYAILLDGDAILLTHQADPKPEFQLPGGGIDPGESPIRGLHREVFEETGWHISTPVKLGFIVVLPICPNMTCGRKSWRIFIWPARHYGWGHLWSRGIRRFGQVFPRRWIFWKTQATGISCAP